MSSSVTNVLQATDLSVLRTSIRKILERHSRWDLLIPNYCRLHNYGSCIYLYLGGARHVILTQTASAFGFYNWLEKITCSSK